MTGRLNEGDVVDGRYRIINRLGAGGMADVYCAQDLQLGRKIALKVLYGRFAADDEFVQRFHREASSAASLQHPNIVSVYDRGEWDDTQYIAMEFIEGRTLKQLIQAEAPLEPRRAALLAIQVLRAARFAHKRGVIHRDLKPQNVMVDAEGRAKVTDFGIALAGPSEMTETGSIMGTAQYLSPEQAQGLPVSAASDLYSVGILLDEMLTGHVPFDGDSAVTIALKQVNQPPIPPSHENPAVGPALDAVVMHALEKEPARRYREADDFIAALERAIAEQNVGTGVPVAAAGVGALAGTGASTEVIDPYPSGVQYPEPYPYPLEPLPPDDEERTDRRWIFAAVGLGVVALIIAGLLIFGGGKQQTVPAVVGDALTEAEKTLTARGFDVKVTPRNDQANKNTVIAQDPSGGSKADDGATVTLVYSTGPGRAAIPDVTDAGQNAALKKLQDAGFNVKTETAASDTIARQHVISTDPGAGETAEKGTTVTMMVSTGPARVSVPNVVGQSDDDARTALDDAGFKTAVTERESEDQDPGTVLEQTPAGGARAGKGSTVKLVVAKAPSTANVPDVVGQSQSDASTALSAANFVVVTTPKNTTDESQDQKVLSQSPTGKQKKGTKVTITVGVYTPSNTTTTPSTTGATGTDGATGGQSG